MHQGFVVNEFRQAEFEDHPNLDGRHQGLQ